MHKLHKLEIKINHKELWAGGTHMKEEAISIKEIGVFLYNTNNWNVQDEDLEMLGLQTEPQDLDLQDKKLYRYPKLSLPRQKVDLLKGSYNVKIIRDHKKADIHIVSPRYIDSLVSYAWSCSYSKRQFYNLMIKLREEDLLEESFIKKLRTILEDTDASDYFMVDIPYSYSQTPDKTQESAIKIVTVWKEENKNGKQRTAYVEDKNVKFYTQLTTTKAQIVLDVDVNKKISESLTTFTKDDYKTLCDQINSENIETRTLAMELMSNSNYEEGFDILALVFYFHFDWCKSTSNWNTVNVKTFRQRFNSFAGGIQQSSGYVYNRFVDLLVKENHLSEFAIKICKEKIHTKVLNAAGLQNAWGIKIDNIELHKDYINLIKKEEKENICI
tara:strand:+ start:695 stop:1852 length:1158 start_codon:yes stop_codon:yes gene_type:complete